MKEFASKHWTTLLLCVHVFILLLLRRQYLFVERFWPDEALYAWYGLEIHADPLFIFSSELRYPPLFPFLLSLFHNFFAPELACRVVALIFYILGVIAIYALGTKIKDSYLGLICAVLFAYQGVYFLVGTTILIDVPITVFTIIFAYYMLNINPQSTTKDYIKLGAAGACIVLLKWSSLIIVPWVLVYCFFNLKGDIAKKKIFWKALITIGLILIPVVLLMTKNTLLMGKPLPSLTVFKGAYFVHPFWTYFRSIYPALISDFLLLVFFFIGLIETVSEQKNVKTLLFSWLIVFFVILSFVPEKDARYILPAIPSMIIIMGIAMHKLIHRFFTSGRSLLTAKIIALIFICAIISQAIPAIHLSTVLRSHSYTGYQEAGEWVGKNAANNELILAGSPRNIKYHSRVANRGVSNKIIGIPKDISHLKKIVSKTKSPVILIVDLWEYSSPLRISGDTVNNSEGLDTLGFYTEKDILRLVPNTVQNGKIDYKLKPVIRIMKLPGIEEESH